MSSKLLEGTEKNDDQFLFKDCLEESRGKGKQ